MVDKLLKPIRNLRSKSDVRSFSHIRSLDMNEFFPSCWIGIMDILLIQKEFEVLLEIFIKTIYFFSQSNSAEFEKKHSKLIKNFSNYIENHNFSRVKETLFGDELWLLLKDIEDWIPQDQESYLAPLHPILKFIRISIIEKADGYPDVTWSCESPYLTLHLFLTDYEIYLLYPKEKLKIENLKVLENLNEAEDESPLLVNTEENISPHSAGTQECKFDFSYEETEDEWKETLKLLNKGKEPLIKICNLEKNNRIELNLEDLPGNEREKYLKGLWIDSLEFFKCFTLNLVELLIEQDLCHIALSVITNAFYYFPESHTFEFDKIFSKTIQEVTAVLNSCQTDQALNCIHSEKVQRLMSHVQGFASNVTTEGSLIEPYFNYFKSSHLTIIESDYNSNYIWKSKVSNLTINLYQNNGNIFILVPKSGFQVKKLKTADEDLTVDKDFLALQQEEQEDNILIEDNEIIRFTQEDDCESPKSCIIHTPKNENFSNKDSILSTPKLEIEISSPSTPRNKDYSNLQLNIYKPQESPEQSADLQSNLTKNSKVTNPNKNTNTKPPRPVKDSSIMQKNKIDSTSKPKPSNSSIRSKHYSVTDAKILSGPTEPVQSEQPEAQETKLKINRKSLSYDANTRQISRPPASCGSLICYPCSRDITRSTDFLYIQDPVSASENKKSKSSNPSICALCNSKLTKSLPLHCADCYFHLTIQKSKSFSTSQFHQTFQTCQWVNTRPAKSSLSLLCNLCNFETIPHFLVQLCQICPEYGCLSCLRKNTFLSEGSCGSCNQKRHAILLPPHKLHN